MKEHKQRLRELVRSAGSKSRMLRLLGSSLEGSAPYHYCGAVLGRELSDIYAKRIAVQTRRKVEGLPAWEGLEDLHRLATNHQDELIQIHSLEGDTAQFTIFELTSGELAVALRDEPATAVKVPRVK